MKPISIQLYSVRDLCAKDFRGTIKKIAGIGYKGVEFAGLHDASAKDVAGWLKAFGIKASSAHMALVTKENVNQVVDDAATLGIKRIVSGLGPNDLKTEDDVKRAAQRFSEAAKLLKPHGMTMGYHNHWWEFDKIGDKTAYELFFAAASADVFSQLDVYWAAYGKAFPPKVLADHAKRVPLLHIKDGTLEINAPHTAVGSGLLNMHNIVAAADAKTLEWVIVELDSCATDMMAAVKKSYKYLTTEKLAKGNK
ncbi:MAG TPA: sugar phosphate isomerase/epimerase [Planctomycetota bacterium]|nr:sugar phosphate isomerase/epimerase [Planctomycetota bacterium]